MNNVLVDSGFLYVLLDSQHPESKKVQSIGKIYTSRLIVPYVVLTEVAFLFNRDGGVWGVIQFLERLVPMSLTYEILTPADFIRIREIMMTYKDAKFDFVDCCIMALSERLNIKQICTLDKRDFSIFRPKHVAHLDLLP
ncbi:MAG: PIN domain-containing protein [bacterium]|nr:PIN domain-containing protein [bacterium]